MGEALHKAEYERISKRLNKGADAVYCYRIKKIKPNPFFDRDI
ncbi:MAG: hypothetical protein H6Q13_3314 [Bacteroidetes bacterium]|nr:hypothetical protein [Bacteroidota bacterium]